MSTPNSKNEAMERNEERPTKERSGLFAKGFGLPKSNKVEVEVVPPGSDGIENDYGYGPNAGSVQDSRDDALQ